MQKRVEDLFRGLVGFGLPNQLQNIGEQQRLQHRKAIKALIRCTHFLAHQHITHTTNKLVQLVVSCGGETHQTFHDRAGGNATYTSKMGVVESCEYSLNMGGRVSTQVAS